MKKILPFLIFFGFLLLFFYSSPAFAAAFPPPPPDPEPIPIDGGLSILLGSGMVYGAIRLYKEKKKQQDD